MPDNEVFPGFPTGWANEDELRALLTVQRGVGIQPVKRIFDAWSLAGRLLDMGEAPDEMAWQRWFADPEMRGAMKVLLNGRIKRQVRAAFDPAATTFAKPEQVSTFDPNKTTGFLSSL